MSNFFEQELRKLFADGAVIHDPVFVGRACLGGLDRNRQVRAEFVTLGHADHYAALRLTLLGNDQGVLDKLTLRFKDVWGKQKIPNNPYLRDGVDPHIWVDGNRIDWYAYHPTQEDYRQLRQMASDYVETFRIQVPAKDHGPKLVYICAPLRGEVEKNIAFARQKAQEVFQAGDIPVCPHLMFPPIADPGDPAQDLAAREMGLHLVERCQQVNVYGPVFTEGMWAEIHRANKLDIPVVTDPGPKGRTAPEEEKRQARGGQMIQEKTMEDLRHMTDEEGLILQGCGGDLQEWVDGINDLLTQEGILLNGTKFEHAATFQHDGLTNLLFSFEGVQLNVGKLAMWRIQTHSQFGGT